MSEEIKHGFIPVKEIFTNKWYKIPEYQRPYVWGKEQVCDLLADIMNEAEYVFIFHFRCQKVQK